ncbi:uncharacterized protein MCYG_07373 [Microsporum canis CBS 113480]|uniref:Uncharacterized protein n=1 Tax=Arthroderma otae (strain ATCC MYA-4605 / CBS 113480) TaxID=554155 RepID=C5FYF6_ARTOC|nr:uncharacterized protein MCYG_07373 [Microsporum canis CBS 113480]EEQ34554.1 predicted protein [Microsporum canis CBS 113480]
MFTEQHRMVADICELVSQALYRGPWRRQTFFRRNWGWLAKITGDASSFIPEKHCIIFLIFYSLSPPLGQVLNRDSMLVCLLKQEELRYPERAVQRLCGQIFKDAPLVAVLPGLYFRLSILPLLNFISAANRCGLAFLAKWRILIYNHDTSVSLTIWSLFDGPNLRYNEPAVYRTDIFIHIAASQKNFGIVAVSLCLINTAIPNNLPLEKQEGISFCS